MGKNNTLCITTKYTEFEYKEPFDEDTALNIIGYLCVDELKKFKDTDGGIVNIIYFSINKLNAMDINNVIYSIIKNDKAR